MKTCCLLVLAAAMSVLAGPASEAAEPRPARALQEKLFYGTGKDKREVNEGRRMIADEDSWPREPAKIAAGPTVAKKGDGFAIGFALTKPDDVLVRIVDAKGDTVRDLVSGVLGWNAPDPLKPGSLSQEIVWDGKDAAGKPAPAGCRVRLSVGLTPRLDRFVAHDPEQILPDVCGLEVDDQGRVYVALLTDGAADSHLIRYNRDGKYLETVFPPNPNHLTGKLEDVHRKVDRVDGRALPRRRGFWPGFLNRFRNDHGKTARHYPLAISRDGRAYIMDAECERVWVRDDERGKLVYAKVGGDKPGFGYGQLRIMPVQLDPYWWLDYAGRESGHWAIDPEGRFAYVVKGHPLHGSIKMPEVWKLRLDPFETTDDFEYNGADKLAQKRYFLGTRPAKGQRLEPADAVFNTIVDLDVDEAGNLFVADSRTDKGENGFPPTLLKAFEPNGKLASTVEAVELGGRKEPLGDVFGVAVAKNALYVVARSGPAGAKGAISSWKSGRLVKFARSSGTALKAVWSIPMDPTSHLVAVDEAVNPPIVWVGNGGGPATFSRVVDLGGKPGEVRQCGGGIRNRVLVDPWAVALDGKGGVYVYDRARGTIVRTNDDGSEWIESAPIEGGQTSFCADRKRDVLYFVGGKGIERIDRDLQKASPLAKTFSGRRSTLGAIDAAGNLLVGDAVYGRWSQDEPPDFLGTVTKFGPEGGVVANAFCTSYSVPGSVAVDSRGSVYITDIAINDVRSASHNLTITHPEPWYRGDRFTESQPDITYLVKFPPSGGKRCGETESWAHLGVSPVNAGMCGNCTVSSRTLASDASDRIYALNYAHYHVKVLDTAGNLITRIGSWGNADCRGPGSKYPDPAIPFWWVYSIDACGDYLYASDRDSRRVVKIRMDYREVKDAPVGT